MHAHKYKHNVPVSSSKEKPNGVIQDGLNVYENKNSNVHQESCQSLVRFEEELKQQQMDDIFIKRPSSIHQHSKQSVNNFKKLAPNQSIQRAEDLNASFDTILAESHFFPIDVRHLSLGNNSITKINKIHKNNFA